MTEQRRAPTGRRVGLVTTGVVSLAAAAAVGWAAAVPVGGTSPTTAPDPSASAATVRTAQQIDLARANLRQVRHDLARLLAKTDDLPRARVARLPALVAQLPSVQVPQPLSQPTVTHAAPPATHTTTGASGARP